MNQLDHRYAFCGATIRSKVHKKYIQLRRKSKWEKLIEKLLEIITLPKKAKIDAYFFSRYNHFCGVLGAFSSYDEGVAIYQEVRALQIYDLNKTLKK